MDWPILVDSLNLLQVSGVPQTIAIDEHGIVREVGLRLDKADEFRSGFMQTEFDAPGPDQPPALPAVWPEPIEPAGGADAAARRAFADLIIRAGRWDRIDEAIAAYRKAIELEPGDGWTDFRLGVALRKRYDSAQRKSGDFQAAVDRWKAALDIDPNQYIWRRRIQQYGPRLDKPYPFYDWVPLARREIEARGETPPALAVEPGGAEFAAPADALARADSPAREPDAEGRIHRDEGELIEIETVAAPGSLQQGEAARLHVAFRPLARKKAHWNNEADGVEVWLREPDGCELDAPYRLLPLPAAAVSVEERRAEFEVRCQDGAAPGRRAIEGYALYYVCEDVGGTCLYRRQDFNLALEVREGSR